MYVIPKWLERILVGVKADEKINEQFEKEDINLPFDVEIENLEEPALGEEKLVVRPKDEDSSDRLNIDVEYSSRHERWTIKTNYNTIERTVYGEDNFEEVAEEINDILQQISDV